jgi:hypothetical protein
MPSLLKLALMLGLEIAQDVVHQVETHLEVHKFKVE